MLLCPWGIVCSDFSWISLKWKTIRFKLYQEFSDFNCHLSHSGKFRNNLLSNLREDWSVHVKEYHLFNEAAEKELRKHILTWKVQVSPYIPMNTHLITTCYNSILFLYRNCCELQISFAQMEQLGLQCVACTISACGFVKNVYSICF